MIPKKSEAPFMKKSIVLLPLFLVHFLLYAQQQSVIIGTQISIPSQILGEDRVLAIATPENYHKGKEKYPVLYLLDAEWHFHYVAGLVKQLSNSGDILPMIVVGIVNTNRNRDLTPAGKNDNLEKWGGAKPFLDFIKNELQPYIQENYRTQPYKILAGHSFGGLFSVYAMMEQPNLFQSYIALSPSLGRNNEQQLEVAKTFFERDDNLPKDLFVAVGNEGGFTYLGAEKLTDLVAKNARGKFRYQFQHLDKEDHTSITITGFLHGLRYIFAGVNPEKRPELDDIFLIERHFDDLTTRFGYDFRVPAYYYQKFVAEQIGLRELDYALFILKKYAEKYPEAIKMLQGYADVHLLMGNFSEAKKYYQQLVKLDVENEQYTKILRLIE